MRGQLIAALLEAMGKDERLFFITADMGINLVEQIEEAYPSRFMNVGIAEANAIGVAAGLASVGYRPWVYTISNFLVHRCFEQLRNDVSLHQLDVTLLGTSTGFDNSPLGPTHHVVDDWGPLAGLPDTTVYAPSSIQFAQTLSNQISSLKGLTYIRVGKGEPSIPSSESEWYETDCDGATRVVLSYGTLGARLWKSATSDPRSDCGIVVLNRLHPLPETLEVFLRRFEEVIVVEDHISRGGLMTSLANLFAVQDATPRLRSISPSRFQLRVGTSPEAFDEKLGLTWAAACGP